MRALPWVLAPLAISLGNHPRAQNPTDDGSSNNNNDDGEITPPTALQTPMNSQPDGLGSLTAAELVSRCWADDASLAGLERIEDASEDPDVLTLARYIIKEVYLTPPSSESSAKSTSTFPLQEEILSCAPVCI